MKYRKRPVEVDAFLYKGRLFDGEGYYIIPKWAQVAHEDGDLYYREDATGHKELYVKTLEGDMHVNIGDYVIRGVKRELYPCARDIFEQTYEMVEDVK